MREVELKLISELMKHSRKSDRELAKAIGISQPTVTRTRAKLEREGYIREYTVIPDFTKLGYEIMAFTFVKLKKLSVEETERMREITREDMKEAPAEIILFERGMGNTCDGVIVSLHKSYSSYAKLRERATTYAFVKSCESFLINLKDETHFRSLTLSTIANHILETAEADET